MTEESKRIVESGYDAAADRFSAWQRGIVGSKRLDRVEELLALLPERPDVLELDAGAGVRSTRKLAARGRLTGVDISAEPVRRAKSACRARRTAGRTSPASTFRRARSTRWSRSTFNYLPHDDLRALIPRAFAWLRRRGLFLAT